MACYRPLKALQDVRSGEVRLVESLRSVVAELARGDKPLELPCGRCIGCKLERARAWSIRIGHEAQLYDSNLFVTLDYAPEHLSSWSLCYRDFQLFMKRFRKVVDGASPGPDGDHPIRFFVAGEYGSEFKRPHWHAVLFNTALEDAELYRNGTFRSAILEKAWGKGNCVIGRLTAASAAYVAGYTLAKHYGKSAVDHYEDLVNPLTGEVSSRRAEFARMSNRPGIGARWYERFGRDLFPHDFAVQDGKQYKVPRYYLKRLEAADPARADLVRRARKERARLVDPAESTPERRAVREEVAEARSKLYGGRKH